MIAQRRRPDERGQALIETAVVIAVLLSLLMGVYSVSQFASDQNTAGTATRAGARLAAELGNNKYKSTNPVAGCQTSNNDPCAVDRQILQVVCQIAANMPFVASIDEIDLYRAGDPGGVRQPADPYDQYTSCVPGAPRVGAGTPYTLDLRTQVHPNEAYIGISLQYRYKSPTPILPLNAQPTVYTVVQLSPNFT